MPLFDYFRRKIPVAPVEVVNTPSERRRRGARKCRPERRF